MSATYIALLKVISAEFDEKATFIANRRVNSDAIGSLEDRKICDAGDQVVVKRWHCCHGPTDIEVRSGDGRYLRKRTCVPFGWVEEMGAPKDLVEHMPFAPQVWAEIIAAEESKQTSTHANQP